MEDIVKSSVERINESVSYAEAVFPKNLKFLRKKANGISLRDFSELTGLTLSTLFQVEKGVDVRSPAFKTVLKIHAFFKGFVSMDELLYVDLEEREKKLLNNKE